MGAERKNFWRRTWRSRISPPEVNAVKVDLADMGTAFGLDASIEQLAVTPSPEAPVARGQTQVIETDWAIARLNGRSVK